MTVVPIGRPPVVESLPPSTRVWIISDLHLGDGTPSDVFFGKDRHLIALIERVERAGATLIVNGDAIDFHQAWSFMRVLRGHPNLLSAMGKLAQQGRLYYVIGNHDYDLTLFRDVLNWRVCDELHMGDQVKITHGYEHDVYVSSQLDDGQWHTKVHHLLERWLGTWIRIPISEFYGVPNRIVWWLAHKLGVASLAWDRVLTWFGADPAEDEIHANLTFFARSNMGDSMGIFRPAYQEALTGPFRIVVCGHSHVPGVVRQGDRAYANTGSWTFGASQYLVWNGTDIRCFDWLTGREYHDELYRSMLDGTLYERDFFQWWRENYMGWLRFREGEERHGRLRHWESWLRDNQQPSLLRAIPKPVAPVDDAEVTRGTS